MQGTAPSAKTTADQEERGLRGRGPWVLLFLGSDAFPCRPLVSGSVKVPVYVTERKVKWRNVSPASVKQKCVVRYLLNNSELHRTNGAAKLSHHVGSPWGPTDKYTLERGFTAPFVKSRPLPAGVPPLSTQSALVLAEEP